MDDHNNFAYSIVLTAPSPLLSGTSLVLQGGGGALMPTAPFNATVWPVNQIPLASNSEIVRVTNVTSDTLTIVRAQEGSTTQPIDVGYQIAAGITVKTLTDIEAAIATLQGLLPTGDIVGTTDIQVVTNKDLTDPSNTFPATGGWLATNDTWTFATVSTIGGSGGQNTNYFGTVTIPGDQTTKYYPGMKFKATNSGSTLMGFIMDVSYSSPSTTLTLWSGQTYAFAAGAITNTYYSTAKAPAGFNINPSSWTIQVNSTSNRITSSPTANTWYAAETMVVPVGVWNAWYSCNSYFKRSGGGSVQTGLVIYSGQIEPESVTSTYDNVSDDKSSTVTKLNCYAITTQTTISLDYRTTYSGTNSIAIYGSNWSNTVINWTCAYL